ncbi:Ger(x)C family spore germination protein [Paenibacillus xanthanilyticus]|uniref:Ger(X)C family spore germination protein n=1 Tax=Paenibacillus xanthanilyticus TaxID=1783531 RepID=A0ABV8K7W4_9BACL
MACFFYLDFGRFASKKVPFVSCLSILLISMITTGCWDRQELEERAFATIIGIDKGTSSGGPNTVRVTYNLAKPVMINESPKAERSSEIVTLETAYVYLSRDLINITVSRKLSLLHTKFLIVSEEYARQGNMISTIGSLIRDREFRRDIVIITCKGTAEKFIKKNNPQMERLLYKQYELILQTGKLTGNIPNVKLQEFLMETQSINGLAMTTLASLRRNKDFSKSPDTKNTLPGQFATRSENPIQYLGSAVYKGQKMIGQLTGEESRIAMTLQGKKLRTFQTGLNVPGYENKVFVGTFTQQTEPLIHIDMNEKPYKIHVKVQIEMDLNGIQADFDKIMSPKGIKSLQDAANQKFERESELLVNKSQIKFKGDLFEFYKRARLKCLTDEEWKSKEWSKNFPEAEITVNYDIHIRRTGRELMPTTGDTP